MRIILLSIAFLFLAFSAQSQVLKSAGVWYFLDVDSMTARPAVLPNGTELAYVVGTKTVYYWNRNTSTWTAYGSTFNRDSIYFDSSIIGSGTVSDPWGVDSTLFATIAGVGDSIAAALGYVAANFFPLQGGTLTGTGGNGFVGFPVQSSPPATPATGFSLFAGSTGNNISWMQPDGFFRRLVSPVTWVARQYQFMARSYTLADSADVAALPTGSGTTNYYAKWSSSTALGVGNMTDNNTVVSILNSKPFSLGQWTTAGRPAGTTGYAGYNTTGNGIEHYNGTRWGYSLESTFARGTSTYVPFFDANGQLTQLSTLLFIAGDGRLRANQMQSEIVQVTFGGLNTSTSTAVSKTASDVLVFGGGNINHMYVGLGGSQTALKVGTDWITMGGKNITNAAAAVLAPNRQAKVGLAGDIVFSPGILTNIGDQPGADTGADFYIRGGDQNNSGANRTGNRLIIRSGASSGTNQAGGNLTFQGGTGTGTGLGGDIVFQTTPSGASGTTINPFSTSMILKGNGFLGIGSTSPLQELDVNGDAYIRDSTRLTTTPAHTAITGLLTRDANGWVGLASLSGLSYSGGVLSSTWLKSELEAGRDVTINGAVSTDFRIQNSRIQFDNKVKIGSDSSWAYNPSTYAQTIVNNTTSSSMLVGGSGNFPGSYAIQDRNSGGSQILKTYMELDKRRSTFFYQWNLNETWQMPSGSFAWTRHVKFDTVGVDRFQVVYGSDFSDVPISHVFKASGAVGLSEPLFRIFAQNSNATTVAKIDINGVGDIANFNIDRSVQFSGYGTGTKEATDLSKTQSNYVAGFATDGTVLDLERKRDTTIYIDDTDYDWSAAITTAQIARRYNRVIFWMTTTGAAGSDSELTLHTPDANLMQVEYLIHSVDEPAGFDNKIVFGTNNAVDSTNGLVTNYYPAAGDGIHIRAGLRSGVYKYRYSN